MEKEAKEQLQGQIQVQVHVFGVCLGLSVVFGCFRFSVRGKRKENWELEEEMIRNHKQIEYILQEDESKKKGMKTKTMPHSLLGLGKRLRRRIENDILSVG